MHNGDEFKDNGGIIYTIKDGKIFVEVESINSILNDLVEDAEADKTIPNSVLEGIIIAQETLAEEFQNIVSEEIEDTLSELGLE